MNRSLEYQNEQLYSSSSPIDCCLPLHERIDHCHIPLSLAHQVLGFEQHSSLSIGVRAVTGAWLGHAKTAHTQTSTPLPDIFTVTSGHSAISPSRILFCFVLQVADSGGRVSSEDSGGDHDGSSKDVAGPNKYNALLCSCLSPATVLTAARHVLVSQTSSFLYTLLSTT